MKSLRAIAREALLEEGDEEAARQRLGMSRRVWSRVVHPGAPAPLGLTPEEDAELGARIAYLRAEIESTRERREAVHMSTMSRSRIAGPWTEPAPVTRPAPPASEEVDPLRCRICDGDGCGRCEGRGVVGWREALRQLEVFGPNVVHARAVEHRYTEQRERLAKGWPEAHVWQSSQDLADLLGVGKSSIQRYSRAPEGRWVRIEKRVEKGIHEYRVAPSDPREDTMVEAQGGKWVSAEVAARALGISESTVRSRGVKGKIKTKPETYLGRPIKRYWLTDEQLAAGATRENKVVPTVQPDAAGLRRSLETAQAEHDRALEELGQELNAARKSCGQAEAELQKVRELLDASQARERVIDKELLEAKEALEESQATIARQLDQLERARAQQEAEESERVNELSRALKTTEKLLEVAAAERDDLRDEVLALKQEAETSTTLLASYDQHQALVETQRNAFRQDTRACCDLLAEVRTLLLTHGETLEAAGADHVYYLHWRVSQALEGAGR